MATLKNREEDTSIELNLKIINDSPVWIGYMLKIIDMQNFNKKELMRLSDENGNELFLQNFAEKEIPALTNALNSLASGKINNYFFEPIDEKDFCLEITSKNDFFILTIFLRDAKILKTYSLNAYSAIGTRMNITKKDLINFSNDLRKEYEALFPPQKLLTNN